MSLTKQFLYFRLNVINKIEKNLLAITIMFEFEFLEFLIGYLLYSIY